MKLETLQSVVANWDWREAGFAYGLVASFNGEPENADWQDLGHAINFFKKINRDSGYLAGREWDDLDYESNRFRAVERTFNEGWSRGLLDGWSRRPTETERDAKFEVWVPHSSMYTMFGENWGWRGKYGEMFAVRIFSIERIAREPDSIFDLSPVPTSVSFHRVQEFWFRLSKRAACGAYGSRDEAITATTVYACQTLGFEPMPDDWREIDVVAKKDEPR